MKYIIFELFTGVGFCNQLFSLETAIYLANISDRKLILLIRYPLCHCGESSWDYGYFLDFFSNKYLQYLPNGIEVYKNNDIPTNILNIIKDKNTKSNVFPDKLSRIALIDKKIFDEYDQNIIHPHILSFSSNRNPFIFDLSEWIEDYIYIYESNACRCFYLFLTTSYNYDIMSNICYSLTIIREEFVNIFNSLLINKPYMSLHFRLGDVKHNKSVIDNNSSGKASDIIKIIERYKFDDIYIMCDRTDGQIIAYLEEWCAKNKKNIIYTHNITSNISLDLLKESFPHVNNFKVVKFLLEKLLCENADIFCGWRHSTVSNHIQYINYINNKTCHLYNDKNVINTESTYSWVNNNIMGPGISWQYFFPDNIKKHNI